MGSQSHIGGRYQYAATMIFSLVATSWFNSPVPEFNELLSERNFQGVSCGIPWAATRGPGPGLDQSDRPIDRSAPL